MANSRKMNQLKVRKATRIDIPQFMNTIVKAKAIGNCVPKTYFNWVVHDGIALVAEQEQKTAGFLIAEKNSKAAAHVTYIYVHPRFRSQRIGSTLMDDPQENAEEAALSTLICTPRWTPQDSTNSLASSRKESLR